MSGDLFNNPPATKGDPLASAEPPKFGGDTYDPKRDGKRLSTQLEAVRAAMLQGGKWTLDELRDEVERRTGKRPSEAGVSARIRDLRKPEFGGHDVRGERSKTNAGLWFYWIEKGDA